MTTLYTQKLLSFVVDWVVLVSIPRPGRRHGFKQFVCGWENCSRAGKFPRNGNANPQKHEYRHVPRRANLAMESPDWVCKGCSNHMSCNTCVSFLDRACTRGKKQQLVCLACVAFLKQYITMVGLAAFFNMEMLETSKMEEVTITCTNDFEEDEDDSYTLVGYSASRNKPTKGVYVVHPPPAGNHNNPTRNMYTGLDEESL